VVFNANTRSAPARSLASEHSMGSNTIPPSGSVRHSSRFSSSQRLGPPRRINVLQAQGDDWNHGEDPDSYVYDTDRMRAVNEAATREGGWAGPCPRAAAWGWRPPTPS
jgi:hypothetical protein